MGVVYLAEQDEPVQREVAVKVLRAGLGSDEVVARFEVERQALALMEHPHITRVYDAGTTDDGLPYVVMERVDGVPITEYADARRLTLRERVRLFVQVCQAVQHAHQKGILHRDLKPSNVLVAEADGAPQAKIIDFGIAKALTTPVGQAPLTLTGLVVGTPAYMSPEQFVGDGSRVDTRSDIYALGVLLYELLVGTLPYDVDGGVWQMRARHVTSDPEPPPARFAALDAEARARVAAARRSAVTALRRALTGELTWVLLHALEPEPERRYDSAADLARDLERYLGDQPVHATGASAAYRARKFVRRHRGSVAFAATVAILLVAFAVSTAVQARRLAEARRVAVARQAQAEELIGFMVGDLRTRLTGKVTLEVLDTVGARAMRYFATVPDAELSDEERHREQLLLEQLGHLRLDQGRPDDAAALFRRSLAIGEGLAARDPQNERWLVGLGHAHFGLGRYFWERGATDSALAHFVPFLTASEALVRRWPDSTRFRAERAYALSNVGQARERTGDLAGAIAAHGEAYALARALADRDTASQEARRDALRDAGLFQQALGVAQAKAGALREAFASHQAQAALFAGLVARDTADGDLRRYLALADGYRGLDALALGLVDTARAALRRSADGLAALTARDPANVEWRFNRLLAARRLALLALEAGDRAGAERALADHAAQLAAAEAIPALAGRAARERTVTAALRARALVAAGRAGAAVAVIAPAVAAAESVLARKPDDAERRVVAEARLAEGEARAAAGDAAGARAARTRAEAVSADGGASATTELRASRAAALLELGRAEDARPVVRTLLDRGYARPGFVALVRARDPAALP